MGPYRDEFAQIEGVHFISEASLASGYNLFKRIVKEDQGFIALRNTVDKEAILERLLDLATRPIDMQYQHPNDIPMAAYLLALQDQDSGGVAIDAANEVRKSPNLWYAAKVAWELLEFVPIAED